MTLKPALLFLLLGASACSGAPAQSTAAATDAPPAQSAPIARIDLEALAASPAEGAVRATRVVIAEEPAKSYKVQAVHVAPEGVEIDTPRINNKGEIVWAEQNTRDSQHGSTIHSNRRGRLDKDGRSCCPSINDKGQVAWQARLGAAVNPRDWEAVLDGQRLTHNDVPDVEVQINNEGEVVWLSGESVQSQRRGKIYAGPCASVAISHKGEVVFRAGAGAESKLISTVQGVLGQGDHTDLSSGGEVVFLDLSWRVVTSRQGVIGPGMAPRINERGEVVYLTTTAPRVIMRYEDGVSSPVTPPTGGGATSGPDINDAGVIVWSALNGARSELLVATPR